MQIPKQELLHPPWQAPAEHEAASSFMNPTCRCFWEPEAPVWHLHLLGMGCSSIAAIPEPLVKVPRSGVNRIPSHKASLYRAPHKSWSAPQYAAETLQRLITLWIPALTRIPLGMYGPKLGTFLMTKRLVELLSVFLRKTIT